MFTGAEIAALIDGIAARGALEHCDAVLSGYIGGADLGVARSWMRRRGCKTANPRALYCCDPVIGDQGTRRLRPPRRSRTLCASARCRAPTSSRPTFSSWSILSGRTCTTLAQVKAAVAVLQARGPRTVLVTGLRTEATPADAIDLLVAEDGAFHLLRTPRLKLAANGAGDAIAALFLFHRLRSGSAATALAEAASAVFGVLRRTEAAGSRELLLVAAQEEFVRPSRLFAAEPC